MPVLIHQRCFHHAQREAVARCPECARYFCRECITEHEERILCGECLERLTRVPSGKSRRILQAGRLLSAAGGLVLLWFFFYALGRVLLLIPDSFHEGTFWNK